AVRRIRRPRASSIRKQEEHMAEELTVEDGGGVRWIAIDRPASKNGLTDELLQRIIAAFGEAEERREVRAAVLTERGGSFCSDVDLRAAAANPGGFDTFEQRLRSYFHGAIRAIRRVDKPVVALVDGAAAGFG